VKFGHAVFTVEEVADAVLVVEGFDVIPKGANVGDFDVDFAVLAHGLHRVFGGGVHEVNGLAIALEDGVFGGFPCGAEAENSLIERQRTIHVVGGEHGADAFGDSGGGHDGTSGH